MAFDARDWRGRRDIRLLLRAIERGWDLPTEDRPAIIAHLIAVMQDESRPAPASW